MYACPECYRPVKVRPGAPEGRCRRCLLAARRSAALKRAQRLGEVPRQDGEENRKTGASSETGASPDTQDQQPEEEAA